MKNLTKLFLALILAISLPQLLAATTYYVNGATGNDANPGTQSLPWKTIQKAANNLKAGDSVVVNPGTYNERITVASSGSSGSLISFAASPNGEVKCQGFTIKGNYIDVKGFTVTGTQGTWNPPGYGIWVEGDNCIIESNYAYYSPAGGIIATPSSDSCVFRNNRCHRNGMAGIELSGTNHLVQKNEIWGSIAHHTPTGWIPGDADGIRFFGSGHILSANYIHDILYSDPENQGHSPHIDAFQSWADSTYYKAASNIIIERNLINLPEYKDTVARSHGFMFADASNMTIRNNIVIAHGGIETGAKGGTCHHLKIINNTFIGRLDYISSNWPFGISLSNCPYSTVKNNIVYDQVVQSIYLDGTTSTGLDIGYNCAYNSNGSTPKASSGAKQATDLWGINPKFVNASSKDYHLQSSSPCVNAGASITANTNDYDGDSRPIASLWDMGADEYAAGGTPLSASASASPTSGQAPLAVSFSGSASGGTSPYTYSWAFGDSGSSTSQNPSHTYQSASTYTATLTVKDNASATANKSVTITVTSPTSPLTANATASPTSGQAPLAVSFSGSASGGVSPYTYSWTFGDGGSATSQNPSHTYSSSGTFTATLTAKDSASATANKSVTITVTSAPSQLVATASGSPTSGEAPLLVSFSGSATGGTAPYSYSWTFGDGGTSTSQNPSHAYSSDGNYTATLTVTDLNFANASATVNITVADASTTASLSLGAQTGAPAPGEGGTTDPPPGNYSYSIGSTVSVKSIANTDYRFSRWTGDIEEPSLFSSLSTLTMDNNRSVSATFCAKCADVNGDLKVTPADAQLAFDIYLGRIADPTWCELENADVNASGTKLAPKVTPADAQAIFHKYLKKGGAVGDCSGNSRTASVSTQTAGFISAKLTLDNMTFTSDLDILVPIIIECPTEVTAFGFDLTFPSDALTFIGLETTELTKGYTLLDASVIPPYQSINQVQESAGPEGTLVLRVGGYKANPDQIPSLGVLVVLVFRPTGGFMNPDATSIIATYDDLQSASIINRMIRSQDHSQNGENKRQGRDVKKVLPDKRSDF